MNLANLNASSQAADALRIFPRGLGLLLAIEMIQLWVDLPLLYGPSGLIDPALLQLRQRAIGWSIYDLTDAIPHLQTLTLPTVHLLAVLYIGLCVALVLNLQVRLSSLLLLFLHHTLFIADPNWAYGVDYLALTGLFFSCCFYPGRTASGTQTYWATIGLFALQAQLTVVYLFGGWSKLMGGSWQNGEALWKAVQQAYLGSAVPISVSWGSWPFIWIATGWAAMLVELAYPLAWFGRRTRHGIWIAISGLHAGIALTMGLYHFAMIMIWYNCCAWYIPYTKLTKSINLPLERDGSAIASTNGSPPPSIQGKGVKK
ncbi:hypothetical protein C4F40_14955 [Sphingobacterium sp. Ka21]|uniref:HTTM-like domain-containing protein n=1 Tax=Sphingobacterium pedocola TaxID=2082722 RepID=A0ABR9T9J4_9SPHI|nr:hypothetical protein [Sphingobacterium pedocola]